MTMKKGSGKLHHWIIASISGGALMHATACFAQAPATQPATDNSDLGEIIVTAQKRSENIRDVPISITSLSTEALESAGVTNNLQLTNSVPGLRMERVGNSTIPAVRGVSTFVTLPGAQTNVAMYIDNVYVSNMAAGTFDLPDISRVDVLKGPQGTLFGRNATGGAIQVFTKDPSMDSVGGEFSIGYGRFDTLTLKGFVSAPIVADKLAVSVSGYRETADNYFDNLVPNVPLQKINHHLVRGKLLFTPTESTRIVLAGFTSEQRGAETVQFFPRDGITLANVFPGSIVPTKPYQVASNYLQRENVKARGVSLQISQNTSVGDFNIVGSWDKSSNVGSSPAFAGALAGGFTGINFDGGLLDKSWSGELNFASKKFGILSFIAGANYYHNRNVWDPTNVFVDLPGTLVQLSYFGGQVTDAYAFYGEATLDLTNELSIIGGLRYSNEERTLIGSVVGGVVGRGGGQFYKWANDTFSSLTKRASLRYKVNPSTNAYFTYSTGFKSGNFDVTTIPFGQTPQTCAAVNQTTPGSCVFPSFVKPEKITAYEVGLKSAVTSSLNVDLALFYNRLTDIQILTFTNVCVQAPCPPNPTTALGTLSNAAEAKMYGAELSISAKLSQELRVTGGISILDATFTSYPNASWNVPNGTNFGLAQTPAMSATGKQVPRAPKATVSLSATYTKDSPLGEFSLTANGYASERIYYDVGNVFDQKPYATLGLSASFSPAGLPNLTVTAWGNNITSTKVLLASYYNTNGANEAYQRPATYGAKVSYKF